MLGLKITGGTVVYGVFPGSGLARTRVPSGLDIFRPDRIATL